MMRQARVDAGRESDEGRRRLLAGEAGPLFLADWVRVVFLHYLVPPRVLGKHVPFQLDMYEGHACVSFVAFHMRRFRFARGGVATRWLTALTGRHGLLNLRTYVRHGGEPGIYFMREWIPHPLNVLLGPMTFGLPYHLGRLRYHERGDGGAPTSFTGHVTPMRGGGALRYQAHRAAEGVYDVAEPNSLSAFALERYTAFTHRRGVARRFRVWHEPWRVVSLDARVMDQSLLAAAGGWHEHARLVSAHHSPGVHDVWMGRPMRMESVVGVEEPIVESAA